MLELVRLRRSGRSLFIDRSLLDAILPLRNVVQVLGEYIRAGCTHHTDDDLG